MLKALTAKLFTLDVSEFVDATYVTVRQLGDALNEKDVRRLNSIISICMTCGVLRKLYQDDHMYYWHRPSVSKLIPEHTSWYQVAIYRKSYKLNTNVGIGLTTRVILELQTEFPIRSRTARRIMIKSVDHGIRKRSVYDVLSVLEQLDILKFGKSGYYFNEKSNICIPTFNSPSAAITTIQTRAHKIWSPMQDFQYDPNKIIF